MLQLHPPNRNGIINNKKKIVKCKRERPIYVFDQKTERIQVIKLEVSF